MPCNCRHGIGAHDHLADGRMRDGAFGVGVSLNSSIDLSLVHAWNAQNGDAGTVKRVFDAKCGENNEPLRSDGDPELLLHVPLSSICRVRAISIVGPASSYAPKSVKLYCNPVNVQGFTSIQQLRSQEELQLGQVSADDRIVYRLNAGKFASVSSLALLFDHSFNDLETHLLCIEIFGESTGRATCQQVATNVVYEARANPADHDVRDEVRHQCHTVQ